MSDLRQAIIPAAGLGTGMAPFSISAGKELAPIGTTPAIQWIIEEGMSVGIDHFAIVISPGKDALRNFLVDEINPKYSSQDRGKRWSDIRASITISIVEQPKPTGLGDALLRGWEPLEKSLPAVTMYPDNILSAHAPLLPHLFSAYKEAKKSVVASQPDQPFLLGNNYIVAGRKLNDRIHCASDFTRKTDEKPTGTIWRAVGRAVLTADFFHELKSAAESVTDRELDDVDGYQPLAQKQEIMCIPPVAPIYDAGSHRGYCELWDAYLKGTLKRFWND